MKRCAPLFAVCLMLGLAILAAGCTQTRIVGTQGGEKDEVRLSVSGGREVTRLPQEVDAASPAAAMETSALTVVPAGLLPPVPGVGGPAGAAEEADEPGARIGLIDFKDIPVQDVVKLFSKMTGENVVATGEAGGVSVTLFLRDVTLESAIDALCGLYDLWHKEDAGITRIMTVKEYARELSLPRADRNEICELKYASCLRVADTIADLWGSRVEYIEPEEESTYENVGWGEDGGSISGTENRNDRDRGYGGGGTYRGDRGYGRRGRDRYDYRDRGRARVSRYGTTGGALQAVRERQAALEEATSRQIEDLERALETEETDEAQRIISEIEKERAVVFLAADVRSNSVIVRSTDQDLMTSITGLIRQLDTPTTQILLKLKIFTVDLADDFESLLDFALVNEGSNTTTTIATGRFGPLPGGGTFLFGVVDDTLDVRLEMFEQQNRVHTIATPMVLCANNAAAKLFVGEERPITINYEYEVREFEERPATETMRPVIELREIGTKLEIIPLITKDRTVTVKLLVDLGTVNEGGAQMSFYSQVTGEIVTLPIDTVDSSTIENTLVAKDGHTVALGGLIRKETVEFEKKVPILGDLPILKLLFSHIVQKQQKRELVILIEPHIMIAPEVAQAVSLRQAEVTQAQEATALLEKRIKETVEETDPKKRMERSAARLSR